MEHSSVIIAYLFIFLCKWKVFQIHTTIARSQK